MMDMEQAIQERRMGKISIPRMDIFFNGNLPHVMDILGSGLFLVVQSDANFMLDCSIYQCFSPLFATIPMGCIPPNYIVCTTSTGIYVSPVYEPIIYSTSGSFLA